MNSQLALEIPGVRPIGDKERHRTLNVLPAYCRPVAFAAFRQTLAHLDGIDGLFRAAWTIATHELPDADLPAGETIVENLAEAVSSRVRSPQPQAILAHLHDVVFEIFGLRGNAEDYYAPANSYLPEVLRTRQGIPITLTLVYARVASELGLRVHGINAPGHFLAEVENGDLGRPGSMYVDPFHGGSVLTVEEALRRISEATGRHVVDQPQLLVRATPEQWLDRMLNNLQASLAAAGQERDVFAMQELQQLLRE